MDRKQIIRKYIIHYNNSEIVRLDNRTELKEYEAAVNSLATIANLERKKSDTKNVINRIINIFERHGDLVSKDQSMVIDRYILNKIWNDIFGTAIFENGRLESEYYIYENSCDAEDDNTNSKVIVEYLNNLLENIDELQTYANFIIYFYKNKDALFNLEI